jgi:hypothetical protein
LSSLEWKIAKALMYLHSRGSSFCLRPTIQACVFFFKNILFYFIFYILYFLILKKI